MKPLSKEAAADQKARPHDRTGVFLEMHHAIDGGTKWWKKIMPGR